MDVYVSEGDVRRYVAETLPRHKRSDWGIDAISRDVIAEWPDLVGEHSDLVDAPGADYVADWLDRAIQPESRRNTHGPSTNRAGIQATEEPETMNLWPAVMFPAAAQNLRSVRQTSTKISPPARRSGSALYEATVIQPPP